MDNLANKNIKITTNATSKKLDIFTKRNIHTKNNNDYILKECYL